MLLAEVFWLQGQRDLTFEHARAAEALVEDEPVLLRMTTEMLSRQGFEVIPAPDPLAALELAESERFDVVVTDVVMPKMSGAELADRFAERFPQTRFVFISGYTHEVIDEARLGPRAGFLAKPFSSAELVDAVRTAAVALTRRLGGTVTPSEPGR